MIPFEQKVMVVSPVKKEKKKKKKKALSNEKITIDVIRTTQRNNIDLTAIADHKANVMLSLNAIMIAALVPLIIANMDLIVDQFLYLPLFVLGATCFSSIYISAQVLKPSNFNLSRETLAPGMKKSPFFFGNFYKQTPQEYYEFMNDALAEPADFKTLLAQDLYYVGRRLGEKMSWVRLAYNIFLVGIGITLLSTFLTFVFLFLFYFCENQVFFGEGDMLRS